MIHNGIELQAMTFNGQEVQTWIHDGVEVYSGKKQFKYDFHTYRTVNGDLLCNIKKYDVTKDELLADVLLAYSGVRTYEDECVTVKYATLTGYRYTITMLVPGEFTVLSGAANNGTDYGGTANQKVPTEEATVRFITEEKYKA